MSTLLVVGGVAAGMSAASKAKRLDPSLNVIALEKSPYVSYGACGMPYNLLRPDDPMESMVVITPQQFRAKRGIDARTNMEVLEIDAYNHTVKAKNLVSGELSTFQWDSLVYSTGAHSIKPAWPGIELEGVLTLRDLVDGKAVKDYLARKAPKRAAIIGGGYIGLEMADVFTELGIEVTVIEKLPSIMPGWEPEIVKPVHVALEKGGVILLEGVTVTGFEGSNGQVKAVLTDGPTIPTDVVLVAIGVRPTVDLAVNAGIKLGPTGAVAVDREMRTNIPGIWAAGDCAEQWHRVLQRPAYVPLGTNANKQGRIAGENAVGGHVAWEGMIGTSVFKTLGADAARTGIGRAEAKDAGIDVAVSMIDAFDQAHGMPGRKPMRVILISRKDNGQLLGAQLVGAGVAKRVDILATAIWAEMTVKDVGNLDLAYAPPFSPVWDPVIVAANIAEKDVDPNGLECRFCK